MAVDGDGLDVVVGVTIEVLAGLALVPPALDDVVQVRYDTGRGKRLAIVVEIDTPWIARAVGEHLELVSCGMIAPDTGIQRSALVGGRARLADFGVCEDSMAAIKPAIGAPSERVERLV